MILPDDPRVLTAWNTAIRHCTPNPISPGPDDSFEAAGADSLAYVLLMAEVEEAFKVRLDWADIMMGGLTLRKLARALSGAGEIE